MRTVIITLLCLFSLACNPASPTATEGRQKVAPVPVPHLLTPTPTP